MFKINMSNNAQEFEFDDSIDHDDDCGLQFDDTSEFNQDLDADGYAVDGEGFINDFDSANWD